MKLQDTRLRGLLIAAGVTVGILVVTQFLMPGAEGTARGTPAAYLFRGLVLGVVASLTAAGIVLIYRTIRVINFAQTAMGVAGGIFTFNLLMFTPVPFPLALIAGLACSGLVGLAAGLFTLRFARAPRLVLTVFAILLAQALALFSGFINRLAIFPAPEVRPLDALRPDSIKLELPFAGLRLEVGGAGLPSGYPEIFALQFGILLLLAIGALLRYTRTGTAVRAMSENSDRASLLGIGVGGLTIVIWMVAGVLAGATSILTGMIRGVDDSFEGFSAELLLPALCAAVIGRMSSLPVTFLAATGISVLSQAWLWSFPNDQGLFDLGLLIVLAIGLVAGYRRAGRSEQAEETSSWEALQEQRPIPEQMRSLPAVRFARLGLIVVGLAAILIYPFAVGTGATNIGSVIALNAIAVLSLVVLTGWAGQVSLGQYALVGVGAIVGGALTARFSVPFPLAILLTAAVVGGVAVLIGLPALRIRGLFLLVVTFAFAVAVQGVLFNDRYFGWLLPKEVKRPSFFFLDFEDERSMYFLCTGALVLAIFVVVGLRRSRVGRNLIALRDNEPGVRSFGIPALKTKLQAFAISGALAGFAGAIYAHQQRGVSSESFTAQASLEVFIQAIFGGVGSVGGALLGSAYFNFLEYLTDNPVILVLFGPLTTIGLLYAAPAGLISLVNSTRDSVLGIIAQRKNMVVPSLIADYDPEMAERKLTPLGAPQPSGGLAVIGPQRFVIASMLSLGTAGDSRRAGSRQKAEEAAVLASAGGEEEGEP